MVSNPVVVEYSPNRTLVGCSRLSFIQLMLDFIRSEEKHLTYYAIYWF